jgi:hypothetical protein
MARRENAKLVPAIPVEARSLAGGGAFFTFAARMP